MVWPRERNCGGRVAEPRGRNYGGRRGRGWTLCCRGWIPGVRGCVGVEGGPVGQDWGKCLDLVEGTGGSDLQPSSVAQWLASRPENINDCRLRTTVGAASQ